MQALEIRRKVTEEVFKEAMRKGKFGITYTTNLVSRLGGFIDYVMIEAANLKRLPEYSHSTFNLRAKTVIDDSQVVPLIRLLVSFYCFQIVDKVVVLMFLWNQTNLFIVFLLVFSSVLYLIVYFFDFL